MKHLACVLFTCAIGCGGNSPVDVAGNYSVAVTNRDNGCMLANWTVGNSTPNIPVTITQSGANATATITGVVGLFVSAGLGSNVYTGTVDGASLDLELLGTRSQTMGNCTFTYNSAIAATLDGDVLEGRVEYRVAGNGNPDCTVFDNCLSYQDFNGTRPP